MLLRNAALLAVAATVACGDTRPAKPAPNAEVTISVIATNDLHGNLERLPDLAGFVANARAQHPVLLVDAGDMFQGTLASNLNEGEAVIRAYNAMGYAAAAIGNHDFDFGPVGVAVEAAAGDDPRGALRARARQAAFPLLSANIIDVATGRPVDWDNVVPSTIVNVGGVAVGLVGAATEELPWVVRPSQFEGLRVADAPATIAREAATLRRKGARVVIAIAHAGGRCSDQRDPNDLSTCDTDDEIFRIARALAPGTIDIIVAGHKHSAIAHRVNGIAIVSAYAHGRAFSRVDVTVPRSGRAVATKVFPPQSLCAAPPVDGGEDTLTQPCQLDSYAGAPVIRDAAVERLLAADVAAADAISRESLGIRCERAVSASQIAESPLGNLLVDLMLAARPDHDLAIQNGGALRRDLPAGDITYGKLYEAMSFDNHFATIELSAGALSHTLATAFATSGDMVSVSGIRVAAACADGEVVVRLFDRRGAAIADDRPLRALTSDYLATGGDGLFDAETLRAANIEFGDDTMIRDAMAAVLRERARPLRFEDFFDPAAPRISYPGRPPLRCAAPTP